MGALSVKVVLFLADFESKGMGHAPLSMAIVFLETIVQPQFS